MGMGNQAPWYGCRGEAGQQKAAHALGKQWMCWAMESQKGVLLALETLMEFSIQASLNDLQESLGWILNGVGAHIGTSHTSCYGSRVITNMTPMAVQGLSLGFLL